MFEPSKLEETVDVSTGKLVEEVLEDIINVTFDIENSVVECHSSSTWEREAAARAQVHAMAYEALSHFTRLLQGICIVNVELQDSGDTSTFVQRTAGE